MTTAAPGRGPNTLSRGSQFSLRWCACVSVCLCVCLPAPRVHSHICGAQCSALGCTQMSHVHVAFLCHSTVRILTVANVGTDIMPLSVPATSPICYTQG